MRRPRLIFWMFRVGVWPHWGGVRDGGSHHFRRAFFLPFFLPAFFLARFLAMGHDLLQRGERVGDACTNVRGRNVRREIVVSSSVEREKSLDRNFFKFLAAHP